MIVDDWIVWSLVGIALFTLFSFGVTCGKWVGQHDRKRKKEEKEREAYNRSFGKI